VKLSVTKNGSHMPVSKALAEIEGAASNIVGYVKESAYEAAGEAVGAMQTAILIGGETNRSGRIGVADYSNHMPDDSRVDTGSWMESLHVESSGGKSGSFTLSAGMRNAPEYYFAQDEGWGTQGGHQQPAGALWKNVKGINAQSAGLRAAIAVLDAKIIDSEIAKAASRSSGSYDEVYGQDLPF